MHLPDKPGQSFPLGVHSRHPRIGPVHLPIMATGCDEVPPQSWDLQVSFGTCLRGHLPGSWGCGTVRR